MASRRLVDWWLDEPSTSLVELFWFAIGALWLFELSAPRGFDWEFSVAAKGTTEADVKSCDKEFSEQGTLSSLEGFAGGAILDALIALRSISPPQAGQGKRCLRIGRLCTSVRPQWGHLSFIFASPVGRDIVTAGPDSGKQAKLQLYHILHWDILNWDLVLPP
jgi:hypothetical protein